MNPILETNEPISPELSAAIQNVSGGSNQAQFITDCKFSTKTLAAGVWPATTDFFTTAPVADPTLDYYDAGNQLVSSGKIFLIKGIGMCFRGGAIVDLVSAEPILLAALLCGASAARAGCAARLAAMRQAMSCAE